MRIIRCIIFAVCAAAIFGISAMAEPIDEISVDRDNGVVTVSGTLPDTAGELVTISIFFDGKSVVDFEQGTAADEVFSAYSVIETQSDGSYSFSYSPKQEFAVYTVRVCWMGGDTYNNEYFEKQFKFFSNRDIENSIAAFDSAKNLEEIKNAFATGREILDITCSLYSDGIVSDDDLIFRLMLELMPDTPNAAEIVSTFSNACMAAAIYIAEDAEDTELLMESYQLDKFLKKLPLGDVYAGLTADAKYMLEKNLADITFESYSELLTELERYIIISAVSSSESWGSVDSLLGLYHDNLAISLTDYNSLVNKAPVCSELMGSYVYGKTEFSEFFNTAVKNANSYGQGGSGGGGGGAAAANPNKISTISEPVDRENAEQQLTATHLSDYYNDIDNVEWAVKAIDELTELEIVNGKGNMLFDPDGNVTREEFVKMLVKAFSLENSEAVCSFSDVDEGTWYYRYVASAYKAGLVSGDENGSFGTGELISRQDMAVMSMRTLKSVGINLINSGNPVLKTDFDDADEISPYAVYSVMVLKEAYIMRGTGNGLYQPQSPASRAMAAKVIHSLINCY